MPSTRASQPFLSRFVLPVRPLLFPLVLLAILPGLARAQHTVQLSWTPSISTNVTGYRIYRGTTPGGPYTILSLSLVAGASYTDTTVKSGQTYYYVATAVDKTNKESLYSNEARASVPEDNTAQVVATPSLLSFSYTTTGSPPDGQTVLFHSTGQAVTLGTPVVTTQSCGQGWLLHPTLSQSTTDASMTVYVAPAGLPVGTCTGNIVVPYGSNQTVNVAVTLSINTPSNNVTVTATPSPNPLVFSYAQNGPIPANGSIALTSAGGTASFAVTVTSGSCTNLIKVLPSSGQAAGSLSVSVVSTASAPGTYNCNINLTYTHASTQGAIVPVALNVEGPPAVTVP